MSQTRAAGASISALAGLAGNPCFPIQKTALLGLNSVRFCSKTWEVRIERAVAKWCHRFLAHSTHLSKSKLEAKHERTGAFAVLPALLYGRSDAFFPSIRGDPCTKYLFTCAWTKVWPVWGCPSCWCRLKSLPCAACATTPPARCRLRPSAPVGTPAGVTIRSVRPTATRRPGRPGCRSAPARRCC